MTMRVPYRTPLLRGGIGLVLAASGAGQVAFSGGMISGAAPLAIHVQAIDTTNMNTSVDVFKDMGYHFDFGEVTGNVWAYSGQPKDYQVGGPIAGHVYETPGVYPLSCRAQDAAGNKADGYITIIVQDPNVVYAGALTVCVSLISNFTGAPGGSSNVTSVPTPVANTRYLFAQGEDFSGVSFPFSHSRSFIQTGKYLGGGGANPIIKPTFPIVPPTDSQTLLNSLVFMDCQISGVVSHAFGSNFLWLRTSPKAGTANEISVDANLVVSNFNSPPANTNPANIRWFNQFFAVDCLLDANNTASYCIYASGQYFLLMGNRLINTVQHDIRLPLAYRTFVGHNSFGNLSDPTKHQFKVHASGADPYMEGPYGSTTPQSQFVITADNQIDPTNSSWQFHPGPQNNGVVELVTDVIMERDNFAAGGGGSASQRAFEITGKRITVRDYTIGSRTSTTPIGIDGSGGALSSDQKSPYFVPPGNALIDGSRVFANSPTILPDKAGT